MAAYYGEEDLFGGDSGDDGASDDVDYMYSSSAAGGGAAGGDAEMLPAPPSFSKQLSEEGLALFQAATDPPRGDDPLGDDKETIAQEKSGEHKEDDCRQEAVGSAADAAGAAGGEAAGGAGAAAGNNSAAYSAGAAGGGPRKTLLATPAKQIRPVTSAAGPEGILFYIGTEGHSTEWVDPFEDGKVDIRRSSEIDNNATPVRRPSWNGPPVRRQGCPAIRRSLTRNRPGGWVAFDLKSWQASVSHYALLHGGPFDFSSYALRHWVLEGSNDAAAWYLIDQHGEHGGKSDRIRGARMQPVDVAGRWQGGVNGADQNDWLIRAVKMTEATVPSSAAGPGDALPPITTTTTTTATAGSAAGSTAGSAAGSAAAATASARTTRISAPGHRAFFRYFRVRQIGKNSNGNDVLSLGGFELFGAVRRLPEHLKVEDGKSIFSTASSSSSSTTTTTTSSSSSSTKMRAPKVKAASTARGNVFEPRGGRFGEAFGFACKNCGQSRKKHVSLGASTRKGYMLLCPVHHTRPH